MTTHFLFRNICGRFYFIEIVTWVSSDLHDFPEFCQSQQSGGFILLPTGNLESLWLLQPIEYSRSGVTWLLYQVMEKLKPSLDSISISFSQDTCFWNPVTTWESYMWYFCTTTSTKASAVRQHGLPDMWVNEPPDYSNSQLSNCFIYLWLGNTLPHVLLT